MKSFIRRHARGCLIATAVVLCMAFGLQESLAQFGRPRPPSGTRPPIGGGGIGGGFGGSHFEYRCSRCNTRVTATASRCPGCGATFVGTTYTPGLGGGSGMPSTPPSIPPSLPPQGGYVPPSTPPSIPPQGGYTPPSMPPQGGFVPPTQGNGGYNPTPQMPNTGGTGIPPQGAGGYTPPRSPATPQPPSIPTGNPPSTGDTSTPTPANNNTSTAPSSNSSSDSDSGNTVRTVLGIGVGVLGLGAIVGAAFLFMGNSDRPRRPVRRVRPRLD